MKYLKISQTGCNPCMRMANFLAHNGGDNLTEITDLSQLTEDGVFYSAMVDDNPDIPSHFELRSIPAILELNENNEVVKETYGYNADVEQYLRDILNTIN